MTKRNKPVHTHASYARKDNGWLCWLTQAGDKVAEAWGRTMAEAKSAAYDALEAYEQYRKEQQP